MAKRKSIPEPLDLAEESRQFLEEMHKETDRGAALIGAEFLSETLASMLKAFFIDDAVFIRELLQEGPLSNFALRRKMAYALGLLSETTYKDLDTIRRIRNEFAHSYKPVKFADPLVKKLCDELETYEKLRPILVNLREVLFGESGLPDSLNDPMFRFVDSVAIISSNILTTCLSLKHATVIEDFGVHIGTPKESG
jgi:DNA-binding MltR family transcriptional regulator